MEDWRSETESDRQLPVAEVGTWTRTRLTRPSYGVIDRGEGTQKWREVLRRKDDQLFVLNRERYDFYSLEENWDVGQDQRRLREKV